MYNIRKSWPLLNLNYPSLWYSLTLAYNVCQIASALHRSAPLKNKKAKSMREKKANIIFPVALIVLCNRETSSNRVKHAKSEFITDKIQANKHCISKGSRHYYYCTHKEYLKVFLFLSSTQTWVRLGFCGCTLN